MDFDVGDKRGSSKFHKEIGPVESGEEGRGKVTKYPSGSEL